MGHLSTMTEAADPRRKARGRAAAGATAPAAAQKKPRAGRRAKKTPPEREGGSGRYSACISGLALRAGAGWAGAGVAGVAGAAAGAASGTGTSTYGRCSTWLVMARI